MSRRRNQSLWCAIPTKLAMGPLVRYRFSPRRGPHRRHRREVWKAVVAALAFSAQLADALEAIPVPEDSASFDIAAQPS